MPTKHSLRAAALSVLFMGLGQFYNRQIAKGLLFLLLGICSITAFGLYLLPGLQGLVTLGSTPRGLMMVDGMYQAVDGDHSIYLLVEGLICFLTAAVMAAMYALNIRDARLNGKLRDQGKAAEAFRTTLYHLNDRHFPYLILFLPGVAILFLTILPLLFSILVAFTDFAAPNLPPAHLVNWNGLSTFGDLLTLRTWSRTFYGVFVWTCVWAVLSTITTY
ncbi:MAG: transporter permease, partial [Paenibacillaceae bacterium]|nr:transporter permease [Paenibacillaceae bacterium]